MPAQKYLLHKQMAPINNHNFIPIRWGALIAVAWLIVMTGTPLYARDGQVLQPGVRPLAEDGQLQLSPEDRCPVCGMKVIRRPQFASAIQLQDNTTYYFCGTGCMIRSWLHPEIFLDKPKAQLKRPVVHDYFSGRPIDARQVTFVSGSDVVGPMGPALVPVKDARSLEAFKKRHGGRTEFLLEDLNDAKWFEITGKKMVE